MVLALADFFESVLHGLLLLALGLTLGGVAWALWGLRAWQPRAPRVLVGRCLAMLATGAVALAVAQAAVLALRARVLADSLGGDAICEFLATVQFGAGMARTLLALGVAAVAWRLTLRPGATARWVALTIFAGLVALSGGWLTHAAGRLEGRASLMALTIFHQVGAAVWVGALVQLAATWRLGRRDPLVESAWPELVGRFSTLALGAVLLLVLSAAPLAWTYGGSLGGLAGTAYGSLILLKSLLLIAALTLAASNWVAVRHRDRRPPPASLRARLPYFVEAEIIIVVTILFAAASLSDLPPAADLRVADRASVREVVEVFRPKVPSLRTPSLETMREQHARPDTGRTPEAYLWSNFSHNVAGLILLPMGLVALAGALRRARWERYWPLGFVVMAAFVYLRAAANDGVWPFGPLPPTALDAESMQHFLAAFLVLALGLVEWRARSAGPRRAVLRYLFPGLAMIGAVLLLTHSHTAFEPKPSFLVQITHATIGVLAGLLAAARWLELRLPPSTGRVAGVVAASALVAIALVLVFYREANVVVPG